MEKEQLEKRLSALRQEYQKARAGYEDAKANMHRIEGAILEFQELLQSDGNGQSKPVNPQEKK